MSRVTLAMAGKVDRYRLLIGLALLWMVAPWGQANETSFHAPLTGEKVASYEVELSVGRAENRLFSIPGDCEAALRIHGEGGASWGSQVAKSIWWKVENDCRYYSFLNRYPGAQNIQDYVSRHDFHNGNLADLPINDRCGKHPLPPFACPNSYLGTGDIRQLLPLDDGSHSDQAFSREACNLYQGAFRGWIRLAADGMSCISDQRAPGLRVVSVDLADINGDGYRDAILRMIPLGPRMGRVTAVLPVSRQGPDQPFFIPKIQGGGG